MERTENEIVIRIFSDIDISELQDILDYIQYQELSSKSKATKEDLDMLVEETNKAMWAQYKKNRNSK